MTLEWSHRAIADVEAIRDYISLDSPIYAADFVGRILKAPERLLAFPKLGRMVPEAGYRDDIREIFLSPYRIIYQLLADRIEVVTVLHGRRDLAGAQKPWEVH